MRPRLLLAVSRTGPTGRPGVRLVASHALGATAISVPWPLLLAEVWTTTGSDGWLELTGAARLLPYVLLSTTAGILADRFARAAVLRWSAALRTLLLAGAGAAVLTGGLGVGVALAALSVAVSTPPTRREWPRCPGSAEPGPVG
jgi:MFS family permease